MRSQLTSCLSSLNSSLDKNSRARQFLKAVRFTFLAAIVLQAVAGGISSDDSSLATARILTKAAYVILAAILALATAEMVYLLTQTHRISASGCYVSLSSPASRSRQN